MNNLYTMMWFTLKRNLLEEIKKNEEVLKNVRNNDEKCNGEYPWEIKNRVDSLGKRLLDMNEIECSMCNFESEAVIEQTQE